MQEEKKKHFLSLSGRNILSVSGISDLLGFDENGVVFDLGDSTLTVTGSDLCVTKLSLDTGEAAVKGTVDAIVYTDGKMKKTLLSRIFK
ncbi:MAG: sporulation protein [Clostridiales bacterium]|jgi:sporulation protein YabP|nr:sporulation protein [Clostridiales bacterium]